MGPQNTNVAEQVESKLPFIEKALVDKMNTMSSAELEQIARVMGGTHIYSPEEAALRYTLASVATPSRVRLHARTVLAGRTPPNRAARRIKISNERRKERRQHRAEARKRLSEAA